MQVVHPLTCGRSAAKYDQFLQQWDRPVPAFLSVIFLGNLLLVVHILALERLVEFAARNEQQQQAEQKSGLLHRWIGGGFRRKRAKIAFGEQSVVERTTGKAP